METKTYCLILTSTRGVYAGLVDLQQADGDTIRDVEKLRHVYYWASHGGADDGVYALATLGPAEGSKVGPPVDVPLLRNVEKIVRIEAAAAPAWERASWR
jgi:hypothetical protein